MGSASQVQLYFGGDCNEAILIGPSEKNSEIFGGSQN
jgi:hypothetical protein